jgi:hypothetical protein
MDLTRQMSTYGKMKNAIKDKGIFKFWHAVE